MRDDVQKVRFHRTELLQLFISRRNLAEKEKMQAILVSALQSLTVGVLAVYCRFGHRATPDDEELFGIYRGAMRTETGFDGLPGLPPQVVVFRGPILRCTDTKAEIVKEVEETVRHELGHFFGLEDEEMPF